MIPIHPSSREADYVATAFTVGGASREQLLREAFTHNAPRGVIEALAGLRTAYYFSMAEVEEELSQHRVDEAS